VASTLINVAARPCSDLLERRRHGGAEKESMNIGLYQLVLMAAVVIVGVYAISRRYRK